MEMPRPTEHHRKLEVFAGTWRADETLYPSPWDPKGGKATATSRSRIDLDGFFLITDYAQERDGRPAFRGHGVYGYDVHKGHYLMSWVDSMGDMGPPTPGRWEGNTLTYEHKTGMGWSRYVYVVESADRYVFRIEHSRDGNEWSAFMEGVYTRTA
jgi:hypothetical protein